MAAIQSLGIGSGLLTNELVDDIIAAERVPAEARLDNRQEVVEAKISAYGEIVSAVSEFGTQVQTLALPSSFSASTATSSNSTLVSASASSVSLAGNYTVEVSTLAQNHSIASQSYETLDDVIGSGSLTFRFGEISRDVEEQYTGFEVNGDAETHGVTINSTNNTLAGIRDAVNDADIGVQATIVDDGSGFRLLFSSASAGSDNAIELVAIGDEGLRALNYNLASETASLQAVTADGSVDIGSGAGLDSADKAFSFRFNGTQMSVNIASDVAIDTAAEVVSAVQAEVDSILLANGFNSGDVIVNNNGDRLALSTLNSGFDQTLEVLEDGSAAEITGVTTISDGFDFSSNNATFSIAIDGGSTTAIVLDTLTADRQGTLDLINQKFNAAGIDADVVASINENDELILSRTSPGSSQGIEISAVDAVGTAASTELGISVSSISGLDGFGFDDSEGEVTGSVRMDQTIAASDAEFSVNGLAVTRNSNLVAGVISGTTLNLQAVTSGPVTISVAKDPAALIENVQSFVDSYNNLKTLSQDLTAFDPNAGVSGQGNILIGDSTLRSVLSSVNSLLRSTVSGLSGTIRSLAEVGITTNQNDSFKLRFDSAVFTEKFAESSEDILALFANAGSTTDAQISYLGAGNETKPGNYEIEIDSLATVATYQGLAVSSLALGNIVIDSSNDEFTLKLNGHEADITLTQATYTSAEDLALQIQSQINSSALYKQGDHAVSVVYNSAEQRFDIASNVYGSSSKIEFTALESGIANTLGFIAAGEGPFQGNQLEGLINASGLSSDNFTSAVILDGDTSFDLSIDGRKTGLITVPGSSGTPVTYNSPDDLIAAIAAQVDSDGTFLAAAAETGVGAVITAGVDFSAAPKSITLSLDGGDTDTTLLINSDTATQAFGGETPGTLANSLAAIQDAIDNSALNGAVTAILDAEDRLQFQTSATGAAANLTVIADGEGAVFTGTSALSGSGVDFAATPASFDISIDSELAISITLDTATDSAATTVSAVQTQLDAAGIGSRVTASLSGSNELILTRSSDSGVTTEITLSNVNGTAMSALGMSDTTVNGIDGFDIASGESSGLDAIALSIAYSANLTTGLGRFVFSTDDNSHSLEFDNVSTNAANQLGIFIGDGTLTTATNGLDVEGKINGIEANGSGQILQAATGNVPAKPGFFLHNAFGNLASSTSNDSFKVVIDGVTSSDISLGTISNTDPDAVALQLQTAINNNPLILAGAVGVTVEYDAVSGGFGIISKSTGSTSSVSLADLTGTVADIFGFTVGKGGRGASGSNAQGKPDDSSGLRVKISGGSTGARGQLSYVQGISDQLDKLLDSYLASNGILSTRTSALNDELENITTDRSELADRLESSEERLRASFLANDLVISSLNTTADFLSSQLRLLENLAGGLKEE